MFLIEPKLKATNCLRTLLYNIITWQIEYVISRGILVLKMDCGCRQKHEYMCVCVCVCVCVCARKRMSMLSVVSNFATPWTITHHASLSVDFSRQEYWSGLPFPPPGDLPDPGMEPATPVSYVLQADSSSLSHQGSPKHESLH